MDAYSQYTIEPPKPLPKKPKQSRRAWYSGLATAVVLSSLFGWWWTHRPPRPDGDPKLVARYMASDDFSKLSDDQKQAYQDAMRNLSRDDRMAAFNSLSDDERARMFANRMHSRNMQRIMEWRALTTQADRDAYLDKFLDRVRNRPTTRATTQPTTAPSGNGGFGGQRGSVEAQKMMNETLSPQEKQMMAEWRAALADRAKQRGISGRF